jgi:hypothetical protein
VQDEVERRGGESLAEPSSVVLKSCIDNEQNICQFLLEYICVWTNGKHIWSKLEHSMLKINVIFVLIVSYMIFY